MSLKLKIAMSCLMLLISFAIGRYTANMAPTVKTVTDTNTNEDKKTNKNTHETTVTNTVKKPNGEVDTTTTTTTDTTVKSDDKSNTTEHQVQTVTPPKSNMLNVSALAGVDMIHGPMSMAYGVSVTKQLIGPITIGVWGLTNGSAGGSIGLNF